MRKKRMRSHTLVWAGVVGVVALALVAGTALAATGSPAKKSPPKTTPSPYSPQAIAVQLRKVKASLAKYQSVDAAKAAGYEPASPCEMTPTSAGASWWAGAMGVHFVNNALTRQAPNPMKPAVLVYLPTASGGFQLVAAEYFKADADQNVTTDGDRPTLFGRAFDGPMQGHAPGMPIHYDLHVWLWKHNPSGLFAPYNPAASCTP
jgi:hypothetical protein